MSPRAVFKILLSILACACCLIRPQAEDITTGDGRVFKNVSVVKFEADGVVIKHDGGTKQIAWAELPAPLRQRYQAEARRQKAAEIQKLKQDLARAEAEGTKLNQPEPQNATTPPAPAGVKSSDSTPPRASRPEPAKPAVELSPMKLDDIVDAAELVQQFMTDSAAAEETCRKKTLQIKGVIQRFDAKLMRRKYEVILETPEKFLRVVLRFDYPDDYKSIYTTEKGQKLVGRPAENKVVTLMKVGDAAVFQGKCKGLNDTEIVFTGCRMIH